MSTPIIPTQYLPMELVCFLQRRYGGGIETCNGVWADWRAPEASTRVWLCSEVSNESDMFVFTEQVTLADGRVLTLDARCTATMTRAVYTVRENGRVVYQCE